MTARLHDDRGEFHSTSGWKQRSVGIFAGAIGVVVSVACAYGLAPEFESIPALLLSSVFLGCSAAGLSGYAAAVWMGTSRFALTAYPFAAVLVLMGLLIVWLALAPVPHLASIRPDPRGTPMMWKLSTGSRVAVWLMPGEGKRRQTPVIALHGGPGEFTSTEFMRRGELFRRAGFDTIYFDQAGTGSSDILPPRDYTFNRAVEDVDALRMKAHAKKMILFGASYGSMLAGAYAARYPDKVAAVVMMPPAAFPGLHAPDDTSKSSIKRPPPLGLKLQAYLLLVSRNPVLAERWIGQSEGKTIWNAVYVESDHSGGGCKGIPATKSYDVDPMGFNLFPSFLIAEDFERQTYSGPAKLDIPALLVHGLCDRNSPLMAKRYASIFSPSTLIEIPGTGHRLEEQRPAIDAALAHFVSDKLIGLP